MKVSWTKFAMAFQNSTFSSKFESLFLFHGQRRAHQQCKYFIIKSY